MQKSNIADNPQARPVEQWEIGYVAGLLDGEGSIMMKGWIQRKKNIRIEPKICLVSNGNKKMIEKAKDIWERLGIAFYIESRHVKRKTTDGIKYMAVWSLLSGGLKRCKKVIDIIEPYLIAKKEQADLMRQWCERRLTIPQKGGIYWKYTQKDIEFAQKIKDLNSTRKRYSLFRTNLQLVSPND